eukprot:gnl/Hemi2/25893_TR8703_c0_g1_i1.p1 gnl/Hemi2/25893_TR8703_c0_g1~~gnl/Hemi2/25893_TR8703_c0_g1_i1.p1  ORF type:complete len:409 (-),score=124.14 gnl/Hemi2/25893_TR8703_c0_g1_i1:74-1159(-)
MNKICVIRADRKNTEHAYLICCSHDSPKHLYSTAKQLVQLGKLLNDQREFPCKISSSTDEDDWVCLDLGNILIHFQTDAKRRRFQLDKKYVLTDDDDLYGDPDHLLADLLDESEEVEREGAEEEADQRGEEDPELEQYRQKYEQTREILDERDDPEDMSVEQLVAKERAERLGMNPEEYAKMSRQLDLEKKEYAAKFEHRLFFEKDTTPPPSTPPWQLTAQEPQKGPKEAQKNLHSSMAVPLPSWEADKLAARVNKTAEPVLATPTIDLSQLSQLSLQELVDLCQALEIPATGDRPALIGRISAQVEMELGQLDADERLEVLSDAAAMSSGHFDENKATEPPQDSRPPSKKKAGAKPPKKK